MFRMPQLYVLHGNRTCNPLATRDLSIEEIEIESDLSDSSMKYACMVLGEAGRRLLQSDDELRGRRAAHLAAENFNEVLSSLHAACALLCNRWMMLELRRQLQEESVSLYRGVAAEALRAKLALVEDRMHKASDGFGSRRDREAKDREQRWLTRNKKDEEGKRGGKSAKARAVSLQPTTDVSAAAPSSATALSEHWTGSLTVKSLLVSWAFLVPKPGTNKWKLALDFRWLNIFCVMSRVKTETLKKLRRPNDWFIRVMVEHVRVAQAAADRRELHNSETKRELSQLVTGNYWAAVPVQLNNSTDLDLHGLAPEPVSTLQASNDKCTSEAEALHMPPNLAWVPVRQTWPVYAALQDCGRGV
ncbi:hypothetical protein CYMTET_26050 [Cymbomonas tetramitiformis]|uniref:Uncharacterized protein n=1 Tax=Cymbomonas tetramitiformis TaxID=36881 RepID=A0AAE0FU43_9CHLO|nr:hypothetical protein CYMTET_26050 [Cymbomonas tetramitiformis]